MKLVGPCAFRLDKFLCVAPKDRVEQHYCTLPNVYNFAKQVLIRSLGFPVRRIEVPLIVHRANPDSDGEVDLPTFRLISESTSRFVVI